MSKWKNTCNSNGVCENRTVAKEQWHYIVESPLTVAYTFFIANCDPLVDECTAKHEIDGLIFLAVECHGYVCEEKLVYLSVPGSFRPFLLEYSNREMSINWFILRLWRQISISHAMLDRVTASSNRVWNMHGRNHFRFLSWWRSALLGALRSMTRCYIRENKR